MVTSLQKRARRKPCRASTSDVSWCALLARQGLIAMLGVIAMIVIGGPTITFSQPRPEADQAPVPGGVVSLPGALSIYSAHGVSGACGENCSHWLAAEGTVHWDGHKRVIAGLDRFADRKRPIFLNVRGPSNLSVAISIGRIFRERGIDVSVGETIADRCAGLSGPDCVALKRSGVALHASLSSIGTCDLACVLILAGGVRRTLPEDTTVLIQSTQITNRLGLNVSEERREGLHARFREQIKIYFAQMGVDPALADTIDANYESARNTQLSRADVNRFRIVNAR
jgi:hypothetical protein